MKKGISLIVLVITIIVMIIIAGAIILALNSSNVTNKASWSKISSDRANLQAEYATILADCAARQKIGVGQDYVGLTVEDLKEEGYDLYTNWVDKVEDTNSRFAVLETENTNPGGIRVVMVLTLEEAKGFGLVDENADDTTTTVTGYDWVKIGDTTLTSTDATLSSF